MWIWSLKSAFFGFDNYGYRILLSGLDGRVLWSKSFLVDVSPPTVCGILRSGLSGSQINSLPDQIKPNKFFRSVERAGHCLSPYCEIRSVETNIWVSACQCVLHDTTIANCIAMLPTCNTNTN